MRDTHIDEFINCEELSDLLSEFDDRLSYGSGELIGQHLKSGDFGFISIQLRKGPGDQDPYEIHGHLTIDDRYTALLPEEESNINAVILSSLREWGLIEQIEAQGYDLGETFKIMSQSVEYNKSYFDAKSGPEFWTQATLVIEHANSEALGVFKEVLGDGLRNAQVTEVLYGNENPQINLNIYKQMKAGSTLTNFDEELLFMMGKLLQVDIEVLLSLQWQDMNDECFGAKIYGNSSEVAWPKPCLLDWEDWDTREDMKDEFFLDEITEKQSEFIRARIPSFVDYAKNVDKYCEVIGIIRENYFPAPHDDCLSQQESSKDWSGADYQNAKPKHLEWIMDSIGAPARPKEIGASTIIGKTCLMTLIHTESFPSPDDDNIYYSFSGYRLTLYPSGMTVIVCFRDQGELCSGIFEIQHYLSMNFINPETKDRGVSKELYDQLSSVFFND